jgi:tight adherence protein B
MFPLFFESFTLFALLVLVAVLLLFEGLYLTWRSYRGDAARRLGARVGQADRGSAGPGSLLRQQSASKLHRLNALLARWHVEHGIERWIQQSGSRWSPARLIVTSFFFLVVMLVLARQIAGQPMWLSFLVAVAAGILPPLYIARLRTKRLKVLERQLPDALELMVRAMRAGHAFTSALQMAGTELNEPLASEMRLTHEEINFGIPLEDALLNLEQRTPLMDLRYFVVAVLVQREAGGNLTEVLSNLSRLVRERLKLLARVRVLSAEGRLSAWILTLLPFLLFALVATLNRKFMEPLWADPLGISLVRIILFMMLAGVICLRRITHVRV